MARFAIRLMLAGSIVLAAASSAAAQQLLTNGDFETGTLAGWTVTASAITGSTANVFISTPGTNTPTSALATAANGLGGTAYAVTDMGGPSVTTLTQTFTVPPGGGVTTLHFQMFVNNWTGGPAIIDPSGLSFGDGSTPQNQHARVDLLTAAASPLDTGAGVIRNFYLGSDAGTNPNPYGTYDFDITSNVGGGGGGTFQIRFAQVNNQLFLNQGVDNVSILFAPATPTMNTWLLVSLGCLLVIGAVMTMRRSGMRLA